MIFVWISRRCRRPRSGDPLGRFIGTAWALVIIVVGILVLGGLVDLIGLT